MNAHLKSENGVSQKNQRQIDASSGYGHRKHEGFLQCQTPNSTERLKVEGFRVEN